MVTTRSKAAKKQHEEVEYEFFGPIGTFTLLFLLPGVIYFLYLGCNKDGCTSVMPLSVPDSLTRWPAVEQLFSIRGTAIFLGWFAFQAILYIVLPGKWIEGTVLRDGTRLSYKMNGMDFPDEECRNATVEVCSCHCPMQVSSADAKWCTDVASTASS
jgi:hypothetical protein